MKICNPYKNRPPLPLLIQEGRTGVNPSKAWHVETYGLARTVPVKLRRILPGSAPVSLLARCLLRVPSYNKKSSASDRPGSLLPYGPLLRCLRAFFHQVQFLDQALGPGKFIDDEEHVA